LNQERFEAAHEPAWKAFEAWLEARSRPRREGEQTPAIPDGEIPQRYRALCQHLALARDRQYSSGLIDRLNHLVIRGHQFLYGARAGTGPGVLRFFASGFPRAVRANRVAVIAACVLFFGPFAAIAAILQAFPDFVHTLIPQHQLLSVREMYDPANPRPGRRSAESDTYMLGYYIWNNVRIGFQTFAGGLFFGLGTVFFLVFNGIFIGAVAGHLVQIGYSTPFFSFTAGHSALELTAIALMGAAGLKLGAGLVMPGNRTRGHALRLQARAAVPLVYGAGAMLVGAAFIEAFWSPIVAIPPTAKYAAGIAMWLLLIAYLLLAGREDAA